MDYYEEDNVASGSIPEFGAIIISSVETKKECFKRKIFALSSSRAEFVKHIKAGMVLFLFEFKKRQLFGVYQASSDGALDIVPHAFNYSGKHFPAQVCFTQIWHCDPLSETQFRDAIRENYFSAKKFNFGLSEDQVRRLLYLFSSRKLKNKMPPHPLSEASVGVAGKDKRLIRDDGLELNERRYMEPAQYDEFNPTAFFDHHVNSFARAKEDEVLVDDGLNTEGKVHPYSDEDFLAKRRRLGNDDRLITNDVAENGIYNHDTVRTFHIDSPNDSLDEVRRLADGCRLLPVERVNENQVDKILNRSEYLVDPLDVRANDDSRFMQTSRFFDEYNMHNVSGQAFASDCCGKSLDKIKHAIDDDMFLLDDSVRRDYITHDTVKPVAYGDRNLNLRMQARELIDDQEYLLNRKLENRYYLDCDGSPISAFEHSASLVHKIRKTTAAGRLPVDESEPDFGSCSAEGFSSENFSCPSKCGHRIIHDRKYQVVEGRSNENMVDNISCLASLAKSAEYSAVVDRRVVDDGRGRFTRSERADNEEDSHMRTNAVISMEYPSFSQLKQNLCSFSDNLLPDKGLPQSTVSHNFDLSHSTFDDATITRAVPYSPEHPSFSYGFAKSIPANKNSSLVQKNHPDHGSVGNFYSPSKNWSPHYFLESERFSRPLDIAPEFGNKGFPTGTSRHQSSLRHESTSSFVNSDLPVLMDLNTSALVNYRGSLFPKLSPPCNDLENIGEKGLFAYPSKSRENHFGFEGNLPMASQHVSKHVHRPEMDMLPGKDFSCSEAKDFGVRTCHPEIDLASHENQYFRLSSNMNLKELHKFSEAPHTKSNVNRRSVFTRLTSKEESKFDEERNGIDFNHHDCYADATADEVMEMLQQGGNLSPRKLRKSGVGGQPTNGENAINEKKTQTQCHMETNHSRMDKNKLNGSSLANADGIDEVPKETRMVDFKRRSDRKLLVRITADSDTQNKITVAKEEVKSSMTTTLKRRKLVRPVFVKTGSATDAICSNETLQTPASILDKDDKQSCATAISICEAEKPNDNTRLSNVLASCTHQPLDCTNEHQNPEVQKDVAHVLQSTSLELKGDETTNVDLQIDSSQVLKESTQQKSSGVQISAEGILAKDIDTTIIDLNLPESSLEGFKLGAGCGNNLIGERHLKMKKRKKKIKRTRKTDMGSSQ